MLTKEQKERKKITHKIWARKNKEKRNLYRKEWLKKHPSARKKMISYLRKRKKQSPWLSHYDCARSRCLNPNVKCFHRYGARGIQFLLTTKDIYLLWLRDKAINLKKPTLDRIDNDGHYSLSNCRFIEKSLNSTKGNYEARWK